MAADVFNELTQIFDEYLEQETAYTKDTTLESLDIDSLDTFDLLSRIETHFNILFDEDVEIGTMGELAFQIQKRV